MKRILIICILTILSLYVCRDAFTGYHSTKVSFDAAGQGEIEFRVYYSNQSDAKKSVVKKVNLDKENHVEIRLPVLETKKMRIDLNGGSGKFEISGLKIGSRNVNLKKIRFYKTDNYEIKNDKIILDLYESTPTIVAKIRPPIKVDAKVLIILLTILFLAFYQLVNYAAKFKILDKHSRVDIVFLCLFFTVLFIPMLKIDHGDKSVKENRMLAKYSYFMQNGKINVNYGKNFESWFNDRFWGRSFFIKTYEYILGRIKMIQENEKAFVGKDGWMFVKFPNHIKMYQNLDIFTEEELSKITETMNKLYDYGKKNNIKIYIFLSNDKENLYPETYSPVYRKYGDISRRTQLINHLKEHSPINIIDAEKFLLEQKKSGFVFCKTGTHMSNHGAFGEYHVLMNTIKNDFPNIKPLVRDDFDISYTNECDADILNIMNIDYNYNNKYISMKLKNPSANIVYHKKVPEYSGARMIIKNKNKKYKLFIIGDSFTKRWRKMLGATFAEVRHLFFGNGELYNKLLKEDINNLKTNKPDIIVIQSTERYLNRFLDIKL